MRLNSYNLTMKAVGILFALAVLLIIFAVVLRANRNKITWPGGSAEAQPGAAAPNTVPAARQVNHDSETKAALTLEQKLANLAQCGLELAAPFTVADLLASWTREELEQPGYDMVFHALAMCEEREPWRQHCASCYSFDMECIEDEGTYADILSHVAAMTRGDIVLSDFNEHIPEGEVRRI